MLQTTSVGLPTLLCLLLAGCNLPGLRPGDVAQKTQVASGSAQQIVLDEARASELAGDAKAAEAMYARVLQRAPDNSFAAHRLAVLHDLRGDFEASRGLYEQALRNSPNAAEILCDLGYSQYLQQDYVAAEKSLRRALELNPSLRRASINLGLVAAHCEFPGDAIRHFMRGGCSRDEAQANLAHVESWKKDASRSRTEEMALTHDTAPPTTELETPRETAPPAIEMAAAQYPARPKMVANAPEPAAEPLPPVAATDGVEFPAEGPVVRSVSFAP